MQMTPKATADSLRPDTSSTRRIETGRAFVNGIHIYYEVHGGHDGMPLVILHGGGSTIDSNFGRVLPFLARTRRVIALEEQGHGRTSDRDQPITFEDSADDAAGLLRELKVSQADLFGFSNGGTIALQVAIRHPEVVRRIVATSALLTRAGADPAFWQFMDNARLENMPQELQEAYRSVAPLPENLRLFHDKAAQRMRDCKDIPADAIRGISAPTLVIVGDADVVRPEHAVETVRQLPHARLAVLPGTDHMHVTTRTEWLVPMINEFLDAPDIP